MMVVRCPFCKELYEWREYPAHAFDCGRQELLKRQASPGSTLCPLTIRCSWR